MYYEDVAYNYIKTRKKNIKTIPNHNCYLFLCLQLIYDGRNDVQLQIEGKLPQKYSYSGTGWFFYFLLITF